MLYLEQNSQFKWTSATSAEWCRQCFGLFSWSSDQNGFSKQRSSLDPVHGRSELGYRAKDDDRGGANMAGFEGHHDFIQPAVHGLLIR